MSIVAFEFARKVPNLRPLDRLVLFVLAGFHNAKTGQCNPANETLIAACNMNEKTVAASIKRLESAGVLGFAGSGKGGRAKSKMRTFTGPGSEKIKRPNIPATRTPFEPVKGSVHYAPFGAADGTRKPPHQTAPDKGKVPSQEKSPAKILKIGGGA